MAGGDFDIGGLHRNFNAPLHTVRGHGNGAGVVSVGGGEGSLFINGTHVALYSPFCVGKIPQGGTAPVTAGHLKAHSLAGEHSQRGNAFAVFPGDSQFSQLIHHMDGSSTAETVPGKAQGVGAAFFCGVNAILNGAELRFGGDFHILQLFFHNLKTPVQCHHFRQRHGGALQNDQTVLSHSELVRSAVGFLLCHQQEIGSAFALSAVRGAVLHRRAALAGNPEGDGGGAAAIQIHGPFAALIQQIFGKLLLGHAGGVAGAAAIHRVEEHSPVFFYTQSGAGLAAVGGKGPFGSVCQLPVVDHQVAAAAGPHGIAEVAVVTFGGQGDAVTNFKRSVHIPQIGFVIGGEDVFALPDGDGLVIPELLNDFQLQLAVHCQLFVLVFFHGFHQHIPAAAGGTGGDSGKIIVEEVHAADGIAELVEVVGKDLLIGTFIGQRHGDFRCGAVLKFSIVIDHNGGFLFRAGLIYAVLDHNTHGHAAGRGKEVCVDGSQNMVALLPGVLNGGRDGGTAIDGAVGAHQHGGNISAFFHFQQIAFDASALGGGDGVVIGETVNDLLLGLQDLLVMRGGRGSGGNGQGQRAQQRGGPAK